MVGQVSDGGEHLGLGEGPLRIGGFERCAQLFRRQHDLQTRRAFLELQNVVLDVFERLGGDGLRLRFPGDQVLDARDEFLNAQIFFRARRHISFDPALMAVRPQLFFR